MLQNHLLTSIFDLLFCLWYLTTGKPCLWRYWKWSFWRSCHFYLWNSYNNYLILSFMTMSIVYRSCCLSLTHLISDVLAWYYRYWRQAATQFSLFKMLSVFQANSAESLRKSISRDVNKKVLLRMHYISNITCWYQLWHNLQICFIKNFN